MRASLGPWSRRDLLAAGAAAPVAWLAGCANRPAPAGPSLGRVVVVGGGFGGATAARHLRLWGGAIEVTLVERESAFVSCPMSNLVLGGESPMADITRSRAGLRAAGVRLVQGEVTALDAQKRQVHLADGQRLPFDRLVLSPGVDFMTEAIGGLGSAAAQANLLHAWKAGPQTVALRQQLQDMRDGGVVAIVVPLLPYRCPPAPYERACLIAAWLKRARPRSKLLVLDANPEITSKKALFEKAFQDRYDGLIEYRPNTELREVDGAARVAKFDFEDVQADVLNIVPPQRAADLARRAGLVNVNARWVGVDWLTMESTAVPGVHVLGDATFAAPAMPKSGHMANQQAKLAAAAIIQSLRGEPANAAPVLVNTCYSFVSANEAMHVASVHRYDAIEKTFKPVAGAGGLSPEANEAEARLARAWAEDLWADTLG